MKPKIHAILQECIERGVRSGLMRSVKHTVTPDFETQADCIESAIMIEVHQFFEFEPTNEER